MKWHPVWYDYNRKKQDEWFFKQWELNKQKLEDKKKLERQHEEEK